MKLNKKEISIVLSAIELMTKDEKDILIGAVKDNSMGKVTEEDFNNLHEKLGRGLDYVPLTNQQRFENINLGFWELVASEYPNIKTGDYEPLQVMDFERHIKKHIKQWVVQNDTEGEYIDF